MDWKLALGILIGLVTGIVANLITPFVPTLWRTLRKWQDAGQQSQIRQQIKVAQTNLDNHVKIMVGTQKDLFLSLFQTLLAILALFILAAACGFSSVTLTNIPDSTRSELRVLGFLVLLFDVIGCIVIASQCRHLMDSGMEKRRQYLESEVSKLKAKLPPGT